MASGTYRFESAKQGRAGCQNSACKAAGVKIAKGEFRFGVLVTFEEHASWKWKHWGCVTPKQIGNIIEQLGGLDGLDIDNDLDILDGYDELPLEYQDKIKYALKNGHVHDDDWKGEPELNRPGQKGLNKRTPKKKAVDEDGGDSAAEQSPTRAKKGGRAKNADADTEDQKPAPKKKSSRKRKVVEEDDDNDEEAEPAPSKHKKTTKAKTKKPTVKEDLEDNEPAFQEPKKKRGKKVKPEPENEDATLPQVDGAAELDTGKAVKKTRAKQRGRKSAVKEESDTGDDAVPEPAAKASRSKRVKTEAAADDEDVLDDVAKKQQARRGRSKKAAPAIVPKDDQAEVPTPEDSDVIMVDNKEGVSAEADTEAKAKATKSGNTSSSASRGSRTRRGRV